MSGWGGGYVTDVAYMAGFYRQQMPLHLSVACLLNRVPGLPEGPFTYLELGCGLGFGAMAVAATHPEAEVVGVDFNPGHVATARAVAAEAGLANVRFVEADLGALTEAEAAAIPEADIVSLHGVWSWVVPQVRAGIVRLLRERVRPGGIVHLSYNVLPAWQGATALQRVLRRAGQALGSRSDRQVEAGAEVVRQLVGAGAVHLRTPFANQLIEKLGQMPTHYLAHEFMNGAWSPCFHADVVADLAGAKLDWVGSANLLENFVQLTLTDEQRAVADRFDDPMMLELVKDTCIERGLRTDVFVRGARRLTLEERNQALGDVRVALMRPADRFEYEAAVAAGSAAMEPAFYRPIVAALAEGPASIAELTSLPEVVGRRDNPAELLGMLIGTGQALPIAPRAAAADPAAAGPGLRLNRVTARRLVRPDLLHTGLALVSDPVGVPVPVTALDLFAWSKLDAGETAADAASWAAELGRGRDPADVERLAGTLARVAEAAAPTWRRLGLLD